MSIVNISIDDVSPHPKSSIGVLDRCFELIDVFPNIKFTLFVPMAYRLCGEEPYYVSKYHDFCSSIKGLSPINFEIGWHGYYHDFYNDDLRVKDREFRLVDYDEASAIFDKMFLEANKADIFHIFKPIFRPPALKISNGAMRFCADKNITVEKTYTANPPHSRLLMLDRMKILYHACEWDKNYLNKARVEELIIFLKNNINKIAFSFII